MNKFRNYVGLILVLLIFLSSYFYSIPKGTTSDKYNLNPSDYDDIFGDLNVENPSNLDIILIGQNYTIKWSYKGSIELVTIALYKNYQFVDIIVITTCNDGKYIWTVDSYEESDDYIIAIWDFNDFNNQDFSDFFTIALRYPNRLGNDLLLIIIIFIGLSISIISYFIIKKSKQNNF